MKRALLFCALLIFIGGSGVFSAEGISREAEWLALQANCYNPPTAPIDKLVGKEEMPDTVGFLVPPILGADLGVARLIDQSLKHIREQFPEVADIALADDAMPGSAMFFRLTPPLKQNEGLPNYIDQLIQPDNKPKCRRTIYYSEEGGISAVAVYFNSFVHMPSHLAIARARVSEAEVEDISDTDSTFGSGNVIRVERSPGLLRFMLGRETLILGCWSDLKKGGDSLTIERFYFSVTPDDYRVKREGYWRWKDGRETGECLWFRD